MDLLIAARQNKEEERRKKARKAQANAKANAAKQTAAQAFSSNESSNPSSSEGDTPAVKAKVKKQGQVATLKGPAKATPKALSAAKHKGKRTWDETAVVAMPPAQRTTSVGRVKRHASRTSQASTSTANMSVTGIVTTPCAVRAEEVGNSSESEASLPATSN